MTIVALAAAVVIMALETDSHHHILVFYVFFLIPAPDPGIGIMPFVQFRTGKQPVVRIVATGPIYTVGNVCMGGIPDNRGAVFESELYAAGCCLRRQ